MLRLLPGTNRYADLPLHNTRIPAWLSKRMAFLSGAIIESIIADYGRSAVLYRLSDPSWFQSFGCVLGLDWHSSGLTPAIMSALQSSINPNYRELGVYIIGGRGRFSRKSTKELHALSERTGLNANLLVRSSKLAAKVDHLDHETGYELHYYNFIVTSDGEWSLVQQAINDEHGVVRRFHWHSRDVEANLKVQGRFILRRKRSIVINRQIDLNDNDVDSIIYSLRDNPNVVKPYQHRLVMPVHHEMRAQNVNLNRLGAILSLVYDHDLRDFETLQALNRVNPRTIQALTLVSELIHGGSFRFSDPARFSFAHGGIDQSPFAVATKIYDETISIMRTAIERQKFGNNDNVIRNLSQVAGYMERYFEPDAEGFDKVVEWERSNSHNFGGRSVYGKETPKPSQGQFNIFEDHG